MPVTVTIDPFYQRRIRNVLATLADRFDLSNPEVNEILEDLGIEPNPRSFVVEVTVTGIQTVEVVVSADTAEAARDLVEDGDEDTWRTIEDTLDGSGWEVDSYETHGVREV